MSEILSQFHFSLLFIEGRSLESSESLHDELSFKLGLPSDYGRDWEDLLDCLSSIGSKTENLCSHWDWVTGKRLVLSIRDFKSHEATPATLAAFMQVVADANDRLLKYESLNVVWIEFISTARAVS